MDDTKTIFALATPLGGAIAVIRISGGRTRDILGRIFTGRIQHSRMSFGRLHREGCVIDEIMAVFFRSPHSYTGEDAAELYIHGGQAVAKSVTELLSDCGAVAAQAGEFTRRAFMNGKMKLSDAEAVMDLINASARRSASSALLQLRGELSDTIRDIEYRITDVLATINAIIDYPDEMEDTNPAPDIQNILCDVDTLLKHGMQARHIREGFTIAIVGKPNVGKSSLLNALVYEDKAIVTHIAGTTRDVIEADTQFNGLPVHLFDTAGLHTTHDEVEKIGIERTHVALQSADLCYVVLDLSREITQEDADILALTENMPRIIVPNKSDVAVTQFSSEKDTVCTISTKTGAGLDDLRSMTASLICPDDESGLITNIRHIEALQIAKDALTDALSAGEIDCMAQDLSAAHHALGTITGDAVDDMMLTRIFERFCVGK